MDKNKDYSKQFVSADFPFNAARTIQQMTQLRKKFPDVSGSQKISYLNNNIMQLSQQQYSILQKQNVEANQFHRGMRRTMSTFRTPQQIFIDQDDFFLTPQEVDQELNRSSKRKQDQQQILKCDFYKTMTKGRETKQKMYTTSQQFKDIAISLTDPVYKLNIERIRERNKQGIQLAELQLQQHQQQLNNQTHQNNNQDVSINNILPGRQSFHLSKIDQAGIKIFSENPKMPTSTKHQQQSQKSIGENLIDSLGHSISIQSHSQSHDYYRNLPTQIQQKHKIKNLLQKIEENNQQLNQYQMNQDQQILPNEQQSIKVDKEYNTTGRENGAQSSQKWLRIKRKSSTNSLTFTNKRENKGGDSILFVNQTSINNSQNHGNQMSIDESSIIGKKVEYLTDQSIYQDKTNSILLFQNEGDERIVRPSNPITSFQKNKESIRNEFSNGDEINNNPFLQDEDLSILVNSMGDDLLIIKIPNLQNYKVQPLELFDSYLNQDPDPLELIKECSIRAYSKWVKEDGDLVWKDCQVMKYNPMTKRFLIKWTSNDRTKEVTRLNLMYEWENEEMMNNRNKEAIKKREQLLYYMGMKIFISDERAQDKSIYFSKQSLVNIIQKVFNSQTARKGKRLYYRRVVEEIIEMFKYEVIKFACEINTVPSLDHFFEAYFPQLKRSIAKPNLSYAIVMHCQNYSDRIPDDDDDGDNHQVLSNDKKYQDTSFTRNRSPKNNNIIPQPILQSEQKPTTHIIEKDKLNQTEIAIMQKKRSMIRSVANFLSIQQSLQNKQQAAVDLLKSYSNEHFENNTIKKSAFFKNIKTKFQENFNNSIPQNKSTEKEQPTFLEQKDTAENKQITKKVQQNEEGINEDKQQQIQQKQQNNETNSRKVSNIISKQDKSIFKSPYITYQESFQGISQINFKRSQYSISESNQELISLRQTQQDGMHSMISQLMIADYEFISEEVYTFQALKIFHDENEIAQLEDSSVFKYTQQLKSTFLQGISNNQEEKVQVYFQHYAIPQPYFQFLKSKLQNAFYFSTEYHNTVFKRIVPNLSKRIIDLKSVDIFQFLKELKLPYKSPALLTLSCNSHSYFQDQFQIYHLKTEMSMISKQNIGDLAKSVEKVELMIYEMQTLNKKKSESDPKKYSLWADQFYQNFVELQK